MKVLLIDDDRDLVDLLRYVFKRDGFNVVVAFDGEVGLRTFDMEAPDLVILDLTMPKRDGIEVLKEIRRKSSVPVIMLTAHGDEENLVNALELGAEDYMVKPFRPRELRARARSVIRRAHKQGEPQVKPPAAMSLGSLTLDPLTHEVRMQGKTLSLTSKEFALVYYLMLNRNAVLTISDIMEHVWGFDSPENDDVVKVTIHRIRQKLEPDPANPQYIVNFPGQGYKFQYPAGEN